MSRLACWTALALVAPFTAFGQEGAAALIPVPLVGCKSDGQVGAVEAPKSGSIGAPISRSQAEQLAYYKASTLDTGVLAPRGWHCFAVYGSGGAALRIVPQPVDTEHILLAARESYAGPAIQLNFDDGDTSGRYEVAEVIGRVFPAYREYAQGVLEDLDRRLPTGPYPADILSYRSSTWLRFETPGAQNGLGTRWALQKSSEPTEGEAILFGRPPSLLQLSIRVPTDQRKLAPAIIAQFEREISRLPKAEP